VLTSQPDLIRSVWVIGDGHGILQSALLRVNAANVVSIPILKLGNSGSLQGLLNQFRSQRPSLLWVKLPGLSHQKPAQSQHIIQALELLIADQSSANRSILLEARKENSAWNLGLISQYISQGILRCQNISWCALGVRHPDGTSPTDEIQLASNLTIPAFSQCLCKNRYLHSGKMRDAVGISSYSLLLLQAILFPGRQPDSKTGMVQIADITGNDFQNQTSAFLHYFLILLLQLPSTLHLQLHLRFCCRVNLTSPVLQHPMQLISTELPHNAVL